MRVKNASSLVVAALISLALAAPIMGQDSQQAAKVASGQKQKVKGVIIKRDADNFLMRDQSGADYLVNLASDTKVEEKKSNPFRRSKNYATTELLRGLTVEVEGRGDASGSLMAEKIKFTDEALLMARTVETRVTPVEGRVSTAENRISEAEQNAQRMSGQIEELQAISNAARGGARAAQETADAALAGVAATNERITTLVSSLDEYDAKKGVVVNFKVASWKLSPEAMAILDEIATQAKTEKGYIIEVMGFASADGAENYNRHLSQQRADSVVRYLAENHQVPLRRIITPFGYGESQPVADNTTRDGREQNRRVEVKILVNKGLTSPSAGPAPAATSKTQDDQSQVDRPRVASAEARP